MRRVTRTLVIIILFSSTKVLSQNLIRNGGFEKTTNWSIWRSAQHWHKPGLGSTDIFYHEYGSRGAHSGKGYAGAVVKFEEIKDVWGYEYLQSHLKGVLSDDKLYCLRFFLKLSKTEKYYLNKLQVLLSRKIQRRWDGRLIEDAAAIDLSLDSMKILDFNWTEVSTILEGTGVEKHLSIGVFDRDARLIPFRKITYLDHPGTYYFYDDFSLVEISDSSECPCFHQSHNKDVDDVVVSEGKIFNHVTFDFNSAQLLDSSKKELLQIVKYMQKNPSLKLEIQGHTDTVGSDSVNLDLSNRRAKKVYKFMVRKGIKPKRLKYKGYGSTIPDSNGLRSRRVELVILDD